MAGMVVDGDLFRRLCIARERLADQLEDGPDLRELGRVAGVSPHHLLRVFRRAFGETPHQYLTRRRIEQAKAALRAGRSVTDTCFDVGFSSLGSFSARFRRLVGVAPIAYQRGIRTVAPSAGLAAAVVVPFCYLQGFTPVSGKIAILEKPLPFRP
jgi:AraC-like DNA-binding protein